MYVNQVLQHVHSWQQDVQNPDTALGSNAVIVNREKDSDVITPNVNWSYKSKDKLILVLRECNKDRLAMVRYALKRKKMPFVATASTTTCVLTIHSPKRFGACAIL